MSRSIESSEVTRLVSLIKQLLEEFRWLTNLINKNDGRLRFPRRLIKFFTNVEQPAWAVYYESPSKLDALPILCLFEPEDIKAFVLEFSELSDSDKKQWQIDFGNSFQSELAELLSVIDSSLPISKWEVRKYLREATAEQKQKDLMDFYFWVTTFITQAFQFIALITHGKTMVELVEAAKSGDNDAFIKAIQIDRTVLFAIPYFRNTLIALQLGDQQALLESVSIALAKKIVERNFSYPELNIVFSLLHREGVLKKMPLDHLLDICEKLGVYSSFDTNSLAKQRQRFFQRQGRQT